jgi:hypothetical protein
MKANTNVQLFGALDGVILRVHPPIIRTQKAKAGTGELPAGLLVTEVAGEIEPLDEAGADAPIGVLTRPCNLDNEDLARYIVHGTVRTSKLTVSGGGSPSSATLTMLEAIGVWPISDPMND